MEKRVILILSIVVILLFIAYFLSTRILLNFKGCNENINNCIIKRGNHFYVDWAGFSKYPCLQKTIWQIKPNSTYVMKGWTVKIPTTYAHINSFGFRGKELGNISNRYVIEVIGDSFTYGWGLNDSDTIPAKIQEKIKNKIPNALVLNLGVPGYNAKREVERFFKLGIKFKPKMIVLLWTGGDFEDYNVMSNFWDVLRNKYNITGLKAGNIIMQDLIPSYYHYLFSTYPGLDLLKEKVFPYYDQLINYTSANNIKVLFVVFPSREKHELFLKQYFDSKNVSFIFLREKGYKFTPKWILNEKDKHPNKYAANWTANVITKYISNNFFK